MHTQPAGCEPGGCIGHFLDRVPNAIFLLARTRVCRNVGPSVLVSCDRSSHRLGTFNTQQRLSCRLSDPEESLLRRQRASQGRDGRIKTGSDSRRCQVPRLATNNSSNRDPVNRVDVARLARDEKLETDEDITRTNAWASVILG